MLRVEGLRHRAGSFHLRIDTWTIEPGRYLALVGPSGAGKTMFLETVAGLHRAETGRIWIDGRDMTHRPPEERGIGFVYQDCWLFPHLTVRENIDFGRRYHPASSTARVQKTEDLADMLHIRGLLDRRPTTLSGGERQRVALARALAIQPRLLFLDEPLGPLDPVTRERVAAELRSCHRMLNMTTIHVTHDHAEARMMGDATAVILDGRLEQTGPTEDVFRRPRTPRLAAFLGCENVFETTAEAGSRQGVIRIRPGGCVTQVPVTATGRVAVCVRPEEVLVDVADPRVSRGSWLSGTVAEVSQRGPLIRLVVDVQGFRWVSLMGCSHHSGSRFVPGEGVTLRVPDEAWHLIPLE
ncbi:MAG TPA: ATP-binding cassette domain-containing protein [Phycisphaerae bacterium]|nr:ATP-binding cassette domain-containing protein [Phycisphaerae bacterium]HRY70296.1 ATP-binding cassette domain-containing protein [Phycisphaerae bacterium]HSA27533.1 ATP-binding cassette domain-containing protein [Phycisphaerae bacterium]